MNKTLNDFINHLYKRLNKHDIYAIGGQGHEATDANINKLESNATNRKRVYRLRKKRFDEGYTDLHMFDCSGLGMYWLQNKTHTVKYDMLANQMMHKCDMISLSELKRGDWVFKCNPDGHAHHIGYVVDDDLHVIESKGRDYGVIIRLLSDNNWNAYGRPLYFTAEIEPYKFRRILKYTKPITTGDDVIVLQRLLTLKGYDCEADGKLGKATEQAIKNFQMTIHSEVTGIADKNTIEALGGIWPDMFIQPIWKLERELRYTKPMMIGEDVAACQQALIRKGYSCGKNNADGKFGKNTRSAVIDFQTYHNLPTTGVVDAQTCKALGGEWAGTWTLGRVLKYRSPMMKGDDVENVQTALMELGYSCGSTRADGKYGKNTEKAVKTFQQDKELSVDGKVGPKTCKALGGIWIKK